MGTKKTRGRSPLPVSARQLKKYRKLHGFTQAGLAHLLGISSWTIISWEYGRRSTPPYLRLALERITDLQEELPEI